MALFEELWKNYPEDLVIKLKCRNDQPNKPSVEFTDYCSIKMSDCFNKSGVGIANMKGNRCWSHGGYKHILLAEDLALGLKAFPPTNFGKLEIIPPDSFEEKLKGRTGVVFFKDYWKREGQTFANRSGDHIDLWNKDRITSRSMFVQNILEFFGDLSDFNDSKEIWFWEVK